MKSFSLSLILIALSLVILGVSSRHHPLATAPATHAGTLAAFPLSSLSDEPVEQCSTHIEHCTLTGGSLQGSSPALQGVSRPVTIAQ